MGVRCEESLGIFFKLVLDRYFFFLNLKVLFWDKTHFINMANHCEISKLFLGVSACKVCLIDVYFFFLYF